MPPGRLVMALLPLVAAGALAGCGGTAPEAVSGNEPAEIGAPPGPPPETVSGSAGSAGTGESETAVAETRPDAPSAAEPEPPPIVLVTDGGRQQAVQGSYCVTQVSESGEGQGVCADASFVHPVELSLVAPGAAATIEVSGAMLRPADGSSGSPSTVVVYPLGCGPDRAVADFELESPTQAWTVELEPGAYELGVLAYFETDDGRSGDTYGVLGLLVERDGDATVMPVDETLAVCPYPDRP